MQELLYIYGIELVSLYLQPIFPSDRILPIRLFSSATCILFIFLLATANPSLSRFVLFVQYHFIPGWL